MENNRGLKVTVEKKFTVVFILFKIWGPSPISVSHQICPLALQFHYHQSHSNPDSMMIYCVQPVPGFLTHTLPQPTHSLSKCSFPRPLYSHPPIVYLPIPCFGPIPPFSLFVPQCWLSVIITFFAYCQLLFLLMPQNLCLKCPFTEHHLHSSPVKFPQPSGTSSSPVAA